MRQLELETCKQNDRSTSERRTTARASVAVSISVALVLGLLITSVADATPATHTATSCVTAPRALVPCAAAIPGFAGRSVPAQSELTRAPRQLASVLRAAHGAAMTFTWTAAGRGSLQIVAWQLKNAKTATRALQTWHAAVAKRHPASLKLGADAFLLDAGGAKTPGLAVVRVGAVIAVVRFQTSATGTPIDDFVSGEAGSEAQQINTTLSQTGFDRLNSRILEHHGPTAALALQAFALIGGAGPGVPRPLPDAGYVDGTQALAWVLAELPHFSSAVRNAVSAYLARTFPQGSHPSPVSQATTSAAHVGGYYQNIANQMLERIASHTGSLGILPVAHKEKIYARTCDPPYEATAARGASGGEHVGNVLISQCARSFERPIFRHTIKG